ncbi:DivIVA domain-containing protein [Agromyces sp. MMS24-K17]|uniref:DivIVA domain-containing protein n=1 Tax=Agromyces sp. MMS24-K17 TaxID=3372850 RepID=UPI0037544324
MTPDQADEAQTPPPAPVAASNKPAPNGGPAPAAGLAGAVARLSQLRNSTFATRPLGYDRAEVDGFMADLARSIDRVASTGTEERGVLESLQQDYTRLRAEHARLQAENTRLQSFSNPELEQEVTLGAVGLLSQAQMIADKAVADAEQYARDLVLSARNQYREVVERGAERAAQAGATVVTPTTASMPPMPEIEYVRTYAQVAQIQLRSVLDALTEQVDRLGVLPQPQVEPASTGAPAPVEDEDQVPDEEPNWIPAVPPQPTIQRQTYISP